MKSIILVLDGFGVGEAEDADKFGDIGSNTYLNLKKCRDFSLQTLSKLGLDNIDGIYEKLQAQGLKTEQVEVIGYYGKIREKSINKDTLTGHWEMMGVETKEVYQSFPHDIDADVVQAVQALIGATLCNHSASGTLIIEELGREHIKTRLPILYSSADSVLQIATHLDVFKIEELYDMCSRIREMCNERFNIQRIIARPFATDEAGHFYRTNQRKDFAISPPRTILDDIIEAGFKTVGVGKIAEIFNYQGIQESYKTTNNEESFNKAIELLDKNFDGLIFVNLIDTDQLYGHRNDIDGYIGALKRADEKISEIITKMSDDDLLIITGDHGNDPTTASTDHSREFTPCLVYNKNFETNKNLNTIDGFRFVGETAFNWLKNGGNL